MHAAKVDPQWCLNDHGHNHLPTRAGKAHCPAMDTTTFDAELADTAIAADPDALILCANDALVIALWRSTHDDDEATAIVAKHDDVADVLAYLASIGLRDVAPIERDDEGRFVIRASGIYCPLSADEQDAELDYYLSALKQ